MANMFNAEGRDKEHKMDMAQFYEDNKDVCIGNMTNGNRL